MNEIDISNITFEHASILIADDINSNLDLLSSCLAGYDFIFYLASNGKEVIELAQENIPDIILTDIEMPIMNGFSAAKDLKQIELTRNIPIIAITSSYFDFKTEENITHFSGYLAKPIHKHVLVKELLKHLPHKIKKPILTS